MAATVAKTFHVSNDSPSEFPSSQEPLQALGDDNKKWYMWFEHRHVFDNNGFWANYCFGSVEDEKTEKLKELASSETSCREVRRWRQWTRWRKAARPSISRQTSDDMELIMEEEEDEHEELISGIGRWACLRPFCGWLFLRLQMKRPMSRSCYLACGVRGDAYTCQRRQ